MSVAALMQESLRKFTLVNISQANVDNLMTNVSVFH